MCVRCWGRWKSPPNAGVDDGARRRTLRARKKNHNHRGTEEHGGYGSCRFKLFSVPSVSSVVQAQSGWSNEMSDASDEKLPASLPATRGKPVLLPDAPLDGLIHDPAPEILEAVACDPRLTEDLALALLQRRDLPRQALEHLHKHKSLAKLRKVQLAIVMHPRTPRHVSLPTIRHLYAFELMQVALLPTVAADVKRAAEEVLLARLATVSSGERFTLAKQSSGRVAAALLLDKEERVVHAALSNPQMTEAWIVKALKTAARTERLAPAVCRHHKWPQRHDVKVALLGNKHTPFARLVQFASELPINALKEALRNARLAPNVKTYLRNVLDKRSN